ncbi:M20 family metallopeptidase [Ectobacillus antri]|jgi:amidohydrolase|uniref:M20 family metallopeptidase n=1 Tax=Ectobacillus antri TaxID=2486280 RepID=UPI0024827951|nr:M20 family metallopeptidase [Ectobacillus antri]
MSAVMNRVTKEQLVAWRRYLHMNPELSFQEENTSQFVYETLQSFPHVEVTRPTKYSVMGRLIGAKSGPVLAIRADMDALAIQEENDFAFVSQKPGVMHACGHDGHTAMLLGAAQELAYRRDELQGEVRFLFQHAEEEFPGGAQEMVDNGVMDGVDYVIGAHLWSPIEVGKIGIVYGKMMASPDAFTITVSGKGGHAGIPHETVDCLAIGTQIVSNLQHIVSRNTNPFEPLVVSVTQFHAGTAHNVIPDHATIGGTVRTMKQELREETAKRIEQIVKGITEAHGASYSFDFIYGYRPVVNADEVTKQIEQTAIKLFGKEAIVYPEPTMGGEDFSAYLQKAPGCFFFIGARNETKGIVYPHHHPRFTIDEDSLLMGTSLFVQAAFDLLQK